jgi:hypothetical protein
MTEQRFTTKSPKKLSPGIRWLRDYYRCPGPPMHASVETVFTNELTRSEATTSS